MTAYIFVAHNTPKAKRMMCCFPVQHWVFFVFICFISFNKNLVHARRNLPPNSELLISKTKIPTDCPLRSVSGDEIEVHYKGYFYSDGHVFDQSMDSSPLRFVVGKGYVIKGWDEGLLNMCVGEKRTLTIPSDMGYGDTGSGRNIPGGATLVFDIELMNILHHDFTHGDLPPDADIIMKVIQSPNDCEKKTIYGDEISFHYTGYLYRSGDKFESSYDPGNSSIEMILGEMEYIKGWDLGLTNMCIGEKRILTVPSDLAFGDEDGWGGVHGGATVVFHVELMDILSPGTIKRRRAEEEYGEF